MIGGTSSILGDLSLASCLSRVAGGSSQSVSASFSYITLKTRFLNLLGMSDRVFIINLDYMIYFHLFLILCTVCFHIPSL